ncbi:MAG: aminotransferase class V-fold PLP-dependent enzyme, partial [Pyrinomonadaceae bacterium]
TGFVYISRRLMEKRAPRAIGWMSVEDPFAMRNDSYISRSSAPPRTELGCPHFAGIFALGAAIETIAELGIENIERRALQLNRYLTSSLVENGWKILSPLATEKTRSPETLVQADEPERLVHFLSSRGIAVTEKPEGMRIATHFFNNESDIDSLIEALKEYR